MTGCSLQKGRPATELALAAAAAPPHTFSLSKFQPTASNDPPLPPVNLRGIPRGTLFSWRKSLRSRGRARAARRLGQARDRAHRAWNCALDVLDELAAVDPAAVCNFVD